MVTWLPRFPAVRCLSCNPLPGVAVFNAPLFHVKHLTFF